jgi:hypothetical protein
MAKVDAIRLRQQLERRAVKRTTRNRGLNLSRADRAKAAATRRFRQQSILADIDQLIDCQESEIDRLASVHRKPRAWIMTILTGRRKFGSGKRNVNKYNAWVHAKSLEINDGQYRGYLKDKRT